MDRERILRPFIAAEAMGTAEAAQMAGIAPRTMRDRCHMHPIGRFIGGRWWVSKPALQMLQDGDEAALEAYAKGDRSSPLVLDYFIAHGVPVPRVNTG